MDALRALAARWKAEADDLAGRYRDERGAALFRLHAAELEEELRAAADEELTLTEAARESGYSADHLRHLVADGAIPNAGKHGRPRIRRGDLPRKPGTPDDAPEATRDARELLRTLRAGESAA